MQTGVPHADGLWPIGCFAFDPTGQKWQETSQG